MASGSRSGFSPPSSPDSKQADSPSRAESKSAAISVPQQPLAQMQVPRYLRDYGYLPSGAFCWQRKPAEVGAALELRASQFMAAAASARCSGPHVLEHFERQGHTWYAIRCLLRSEGLGSLEWLAPRRLCQMRQLLHEPLKTELAGNYQLHFADASFASRGGLPGTTARLDHWCTLLATAINSGALPPKLVSLALRFLAAPARSEADVAGAWGVEQSEEEEEEGPREPSAPAGSAGRRKPAELEEGLAAGEEPREALGTPGAQPHVEVPQGALGIPAVDICEDDLDASPLTPDIQSDCSD